MSVITKSVLIKAPVNKVYEFVTNPANWTRYVTSLVEVKDFSSEAPEKGTTFGWTYKMMGMKFSGRGTVAEALKNKHFALSLKSRVQINEAYEFLKSEDGHTELKVRIEYEMPGEMLKIISSNTLVEKLNQLEAKSVLEKIKAMCEV